MWTACKSIGQVPAFSILPTLRHFLGEFGLALFLSFFYFFITFLLDQQRKDSRENDHRVSDIFCHGLACVLSFFYRGRFPNVVNVVNFRFVFLLMVVPLRLGNCMTCTFCEGILEGSGKNGHL